MHPDLKAACDRMKEEAKLENPRPVMQVISKPGHHPGLDDGCSDNVIPQWFQRLTKWMDEYRTDDQKGIWKISYGVCLSRSGGMGEKEWGELEQRVRTIADRYRQSHKLVQPGSISACFDKYMATTPAKIAEMPDESHRWYYMRMTTTLLCHWAMGGGDEQAPLPGPVDDLVREIMRAWALMTATPAIGCNP